MKNFYVIILCIIVSLTCIFNFSSCSNSSDSGTFDGIYFGRPPRKLRPGQGYFEVWLGFKKAGGGKDWVSILKFDRVTGTDHPFLNDVPATLTIPENVIPDSAISAAISIELESDPDPATPNRIFMSGEFNEQTNTVVMDLSGQDALNMDLSNDTLISGKFVIATPSMAFNDSAYGVWFVDAPFGQTQGPGLKLPTLPTGFEYEGWVATQSETVQLSTGKFHSASGADIDTAGPNAGSMPVPAFPGQDLYTTDYNDQMQGFIRFLPSSVDSATYKSIFHFPVKVTSLIPDNPLKPKDQPITDYWDVVVSIEPEPDNDPYQPFAIFPLVKFGQSLLNAPVNTVIPMDHFTEGVTPLVSIDRTKLK